MCKSKSYKVVGHWGDWSLRTSGKGEDGAQNVLYCTPLEQNGDDYHGQFDKPGCKTVVSKSV